MKYNFYINQVVAVELGDVDVIDCIIIEWLRDICVSQSPRIVEQRLAGYTWVSYQYAIDDLPLLGLNSKEAFRKRLQKLLEKGYFSAKLDKQRIYVKPTVKTDKLFYQSESTVNSSLRHRQPQLTVATKPSTTVDGPSTTVDGSSERLTEVNRQPQLTNPINPNTKTLPSSNFEDSKSSKRPDYRGIPSPTADRMREARKKGLKPWEAITKSSDYKN